MKVFKVLIPILLILLTSIISYAQNGFRSNDGWGAGWGITDYWTGTGFGTTFGKTYQNTSGNGNRFFRLYTDWSGGMREHGPNGNNDILVTIGTPLTLQTGNNKAYYINVTGGASNFNYVFRTRYGDGINNTPELLVLEVQGAVVSPSLVTQSPTAAGVLPSSVVTVTATTSAALPTSQGVYLRYTSNNWVSSTILPMTGSATTYTALIPEFAASVVVNYYVFTSGSGITIPTSEADFYTINGNTNNGSNFTYTVTNGGLGVTVTPTNPLDNVNVTVSFDATGTSLAGATKVYFHSGISTTVASPTSFDVVKGNWGQDDGVGQMTNTGGNNWQIVISSLRGYYDVPSDKDVFGLNFLFRNAAGTTVENNGGSNYFRVTNPGSYFTITSPTTTIHFAPTLQSFTTTATANVVPSTWTLYEIEPSNNSVLSTLNVQNGGLSYSFPIAITSTILRKFQITTDFAGVSKSKTFSILGYSGNNEADRPSWTKTGINYHSDDTTKATLVLHAPTYTRYKKGNGTVAGTNTTAPKNIVYIVGDFNNWTPSDAYRLARDRDGWNGSTDADGDEDRGDYWWITLTGLTPGQEYVFQYLIDGTLQVADPYTAKVSDFDDVYITNSTYPGLISYRPQATDRASIVQTDQIPYQFIADAFTRPTDNNLNIYELHFRDFTSAGTYLAAIDKLDYLKGLGVNAIHVMPVSEFEGNSSWGYNPNFYFAADKAYGPADDLKLFIDECHKRKIQVFNDLVLNHAFYSNVMARMYWNTAQSRPANDNPWFNPEHKMVANPAGWWGADWNHESEHTQVMMDRALDYWMQEFKFDGFRFDFTKGFGQSEQNPSDPWASNYNQDRIDLLLRMANGLKTRNPGAVVIFEHLATSTEDKALADTGILMWSGVGHHNDMKGFILGYNADNTNIYNSGVYNAAGRNFNLANWMSYAESHDEERLGFELSQNYNGAKNTTTLIDRMKIALAFNLLLPGPRMLWQFQELGYDFSINRCPDGTINSSCRTDPKPVRWDYYDDPKRIELYRLVSKIFKIRNRYALYSTAPDYGNIGLGAGNIATPRVMRLSSNDGKHVIVISNLDPNNGRTASPGYDVTGTWYKYNGASAVDGTSYTVGNINDNYGLAASETLILTNFEIDLCTDVRNIDDAGIGSLRNAISCAPLGGTVYFDYRLAGQTIELSTPILIDKNVTIEGWPSKNINITGASFTQPVFSITAGNVVAINGLTLTCANGNAAGRCLVNSGTLTLGDIDFNDTNGNAMLGNSVQNDTNGTLNIKYNVSITK